LAESTPATAVAEFDTTVAVVAPSPERVAEHEVVGRLVGEREPELAEAIHLAPDGGESAVASGCGVRISALNADAAKGRSRTRSSVTTAKCPGAGRVIILTAEGRSAARQA